ESPAEPPVRGEETVLVVEDEEIVRHVLRGLLSRQGYRVLEANDGPTALTVFHESKSRVALLVTDVVMPGMNGRQLADRLKTQDPQLPVLYVSAYTEDIVARRGILDGGIAFLDKSCIHK